MKVNIGDRVGALLDSDKDQVRLFGFGVYDGEQVPQVNDDGILSMMASQQIPNPQITLDNGKKVYGCECWWGPEEKVKNELIAGKKVIEVDIDEARNGVFS